MKCSRYLSWISIWKWIFKIKSAPIRVQWWTLVNCTTRNTIQWNVSRNSNIFVQQIRLNVVWKMVAILYRPKCVDHNSGISPRSLHNSNTNCETESESPIKSWASKQSFCQWFHMPWHVPGMRNVEWDTVCTPTWMISYKPYSIYIDGLVNHCNSSIAIALELLQSRTKQSKCVSKLDHPRWTDGKPLLKPLPGLYALKSKASYRQISWNLEAMTPAR